MPKPWSLLARATAFLLAAAGAAWVRAENEPLTYTLVAAALVCLGAWLALEIQDTSRRDGRDDTDGDTDR